LIAAYFLGHPVYIYTPCLKKVQNLSFALGLSNGEMISMKIGRNKRFTKMNIKCPVHLKYVLALYHGKFEVSD